MKEKFQLKFRMVSAAIFMFVLEPQTSYGQTITASFAQKIVQYDYLGDFSCGFAKVKKGAKYGFIDKAGNEIVPCTYDNVGDFHNNMAWVENHDWKYGYIDNMGELIIPCKYKRAQDFSEGLAWVNDNGPWRCIDNNGKVVFTLEIMSEDRSNFTDGLSVITPPEGESSIVNTKGEVLKLSGHSWLGNGISDGMIMCADTDEESGETKYVYLDKEGKVKLDCSTIQGDYNYSPFINGLAAVINIDNNNNMTVGYIDKTGKMVIKASLPYYGISEVDEDPFHRSEGMIRTIKNVGNEESGDYDLKYGFIDDKGNLVVPYKYTDAHDYSGGLAAVCDDEGKWGFIDKGGNIIIQFKYDGVSWNSFQDGFALVQIGDRFGYVDKQGNDTFSVK